MLTAKEYFLKRSPDGRTIPPYIALSAEQYDELVKEARKQGYTEAAEILKPDYIDEEFNDLVLAKKQAVLNARDQIK
jgi:hypothetical protein